MQKQVVANEDLMIEHSGSARHRKSVPCFYSAVVRFVLPSLAIGFLFLSAWPIRAYGQTDCRAKTDPSAFASYFLPQQGGAHKVEVVNPSPSGWNGSAWVVTNLGEVSWLKIVSAVGKGGEGTINVSLEANPGGNCRVASLSIAGISPWYPVRIDIWQTGIGEGPIITTGEKQVSAQPPAVVNMPPQPKQLGAIAKPVPQPAAVLKVDRQPAQQASKAQVASKPKKIKIAGYVTEIVSPTEFQLEDYRITRDDTFKLELENLSPEVSFKIEDVRMGTEMEIQGLFYPDTSELRASTIKVDMVQFKKLKQTAILGKPPKGITKSAEGWSGTFFADGQRIEVTPATQVVFKLTSREKKLVKEQEKQKTNAQKPEQAEPDPGEYRPLESLDEVTTGMIMTYEGVRNVEDGSVEASRVEFMVNDFEKGEANLFKQLKTKIKPWDASSLKPGELSISRVGKFKLLPNNEVQAYVQNLGKSLIPKYLVDVPETDPSKIPFQFFVVINKEANAFALPNGTIVVHSGLLTLAENEAQLASVLSHEIVHAAQEHTWRQMQYHKTKLALLSIGAVFASAYGLQGVADVANMIVAAVRSGYSRSLENQADREGLRYMVEAGYDPREAPRFWKVITNAYGLQPTNFFYSSHDNQAVRRSYLMNEIRNNYSALDYSNVKRGDDSSFAAMKDMVQVASSKKKGSR